MDKTPLQEVSDHQSEFRHKLFGDLRSLINDGASDSDLLDYILEDKNREFLQKNQDWVSETIIPYLMSDNTKKKVERVYDEDPLKFKTFELIRELIASFPKIKGVNHVLSGMNSISVKYSEIEEFAKVMPEKNRLKNIHIEIDTISYQQIRELGNYIADSVNLFLTGRLVINDIPTTFLNMTKEGLLKIKSLSDLFDLFNSDLWNQINTYRTLQEAGTTSSSRNSIALNLSTHCNSVDINELIQIQAMVDEVVPHIPMFGLADVLTNDLTSITSVEELINSDIWNQINTYRTLQEAGTISFNRNPIALNLSTHWDSVNVNELIQIQAMVDEIADHVPITLAEELVRSLTSITSVEELINSDLWNQISNN